MPNSIQVLEKKVRLYKRGKSSYWQAEYKLPNGSRERASTGTADEAKAKEKMQRELAQQQAMHKEKDAMRKAFDGQ